MSFSDDALPEMPPPPRQVIATRTEFARWDRAALKARQSWPEFVRAALDRAAAPEDGADQ